MALTKLNNKAVANVTTLPVALGDMVFLAKQSITSPVSSVEFVHGSGGVDFTSYKEYIFYLINLHHNSNSEPDITVNFSTDAGANYNVTKTTTSFRAYHGENDSGGVLQYYTPTDLAQSTGNQYLSFNSGNANDEAMSGYLQLFNPSSTVFVKHFMGIISEVHGLPRSNINHFAGYCNTTSAIDAVRFNGEYAEGTASTIDDGTILLFGIN